MNNPILNSESFDRSACNLEVAIDRALSRYTFDQDVLRFERAVEKMARILGMQSENDQRKAIGASMAYVESDFCNL